MQDQEVKNIYIIYKVDKIDILYIAVFFPKLLASGPFEEYSLNYIVMPKYDIDLEKIFVNTKRKFKLETVVTIGL